MTPPSLTPEDQREVQALLDAELSRSRLWSKNDRTQFRELGWIFAAAVLTFLLIVGAQFVLNNLNAQLVSAYVLCVSVTLSGWGFVRALICWRRQGRTLCLAYMFAFFFGMIFFIPLSMQVVSSSVPLFYQGGNTPLRRK